jgi:phosphoribosyl-ATP pyrophosphohydrolase
MSENTRNSISNINSSFNFEILYQIIKQRFLSNNLNSYSYKLLNSSGEFIAQKVGEEAVEVVIANMLNQQHKNSETKENLINELSDLFYHTLVLMVKNDLKLDEIYNELKKRNE